MAQPDSLVLSRWGSYEASQQPCNSASQQSFSTSATLHLCPGRPLQSYIRNLANMVNRGAQTIKVLTLRLQDSVSSQWGTTVEMRVSHLCSSFVHFSFSHPSMCLGCLSFHPIVCIVDKNTTVQLLCVYTKIRRTFADTASLHIWHRFERKQLSCSIRIRSMHSQKCSLAGIRLCPQVFGLLDVYLCVLV